MILTVTPNPAIDRTALVEEIRFDAVLRPQQLLVLPGGKGINVARAAARLGAAVRTTGFAGGLAGRWLVERLVEEDLDPRFVDVVAETRTTYTTTDRLGRAVLVYEDGPEIEARDAERLLGLLDEQLRGAVRPLVVIAGSMPRGAVGALCARLVARCREHDAISIVDTSGAALREAMSAGATFVKVNAEEAVEAGFGPAAGHWPGHAARLARALVEAGAGTAVVTGGAQGAVAFDGAHAWTVEPPRIEVVSTVGSGDAFTAGLALGIDRRRPLPECLVSAAAAGAANAATAGAGRFTLAQQRSLAGATRVTETGA